MAAIRLLILSGSARAGSFNLKLAAAAGEMARVSAAEVRPIDLRALALPVYDADIEAASGVPASAAALRDAIQESDAVLIASPEYNGFPPPLLLNAFDWLSRAPEGLKATTNKPVALLAASPGPMGGLRAMNTLRLYLQMNFAMVVLPQQFALGKAADAFDDAGALKDPKAAQAVQGVVAAALKMAAALRKDGA